MAEKRPREEEIEIKEDQKKERRNDLISFLTDEEWLSQLKGEFHKPYFEKLQNFLEKEYSNTIVFPPRELIFNALNSTPLTNVKVVIYGQDPYHGPKQAMGLSFSVPKNVSIPSSLLNIFKELKAEIPSWNHPGHGDLTEWSKKGVLLLNSCLTVEGGEAGSHAQQGWEIFTDKIMEIVTKRKEPVVFILWGNFAIKKKSLVTAPNHLVLTSAHPSGLSAHKGFFGNGHFKKTIDFLEDNGIDFDWNI